MAAQPRRVPFSEAGVRLEPHEIATLQRLVAAGWDPEILLPSGAEGSRTADLRVGPVEWEMKSPTGGGRHTISHQLERGSRQCDRIVLDLARSPLDDASVIAEVRRRVRGSARITEVVIVTKTGALVHVMRDES